MTRYHITWRVALLYAVLTLVFTYPVWVHPATRVLWMGDDTNLFAWTLSWDTYALTHHPLSIFDANIYYPERYTLAYSENLIGSTLFAAPVLWLTRNPILAINVVALISCFLCGLGAYVLARRTGVGPLGAALAGIVFAFAPPRLLRLGQLHLTTVQWLPFGLASLHAYLDEGRRSDLRLALGFFTLQALTSGHGAVFLLIGMALLAAWRFALGERLMLSRRVRDVGITGFLLLLPTVLLVIPYQVVQREIGLQRTLEDWATSGASFLSSPAHVHQRFLSLVPGLRVNQQAQADLFPGFLPLLLALLALRPRATTPAEKRRETRRSPGRWTRVAGSLRGSTVAFYALLTFVSLLLSAPPPLGVWPHVYWLPGLNFIRVPSRFTILALLGTAVLAGHGFDRAGDRLGRRGRATLAALAGVLLCVEMAAMPLNPVEYDVKLPAADRWLATRAKPFAVAEVPLGDAADSHGFERRQATFMLHSIAHWQKTIHAFSGFRPPRHERLYEELGSFPDLDSLRSLSRLGITYVVVHTDLYPAGEWEKVEPRLAEFGDWLTLEYQDKAGRVYALHDAERAAGLGGH